MIKNYKEIKSKTFICDFKPLSLSTMCTGFPNKENHYQIADNRFASRKLTHVYSIA